EVPGAVTREERRRPRGCVEHELTGLADRQAAQCVAVEVEVGDLLDRAAAEVRVGGALRDPVEELVRRAGGFPLPLGPARREAHCLLQLRARNACRRADIQEPGAVRAEGALD